MVQIVLDTNVLIAGLRSRRGASFRLLSLIPQQLFQINLSVAIVLEYEAVAKRMAPSIGLTHDDVDTLLDYLCTVANHCQVFFLWRPLLADPADDFVLELAVAAGCRYIVTHNVRHFQGIGHFGVDAMTPKAFLEQIGGSP
jgi:putative PIN family toxin of toxin-antitoxin system